MALVHAPRVAAAAANHPRGENRAPEDILHATQGIAVCRLAGAPPFPALEPVWLRVLLEIRLTGGCPLGMRPRGLA
jgi:hypothetical protein